MFNTNFVASSEIMIPGNHFSARFSHWPDGIPLKPLVSSLSQIGLRLVWKTGRTGVLAATSSPRSSHYLSVDLCIYSRLEAIMSAPGQ